MKRTSSELRPVHGFDFAAFEAALTRFDAAAFDAATVASAADAWAERAQNEHASVAAFDRFSLGLLAVGAPPELLEASHFAALDEILHARLSFALASTYAGSALGPGPLPISGALEAVATLPDLVRATITEGCVGETLAALEVKAAIDTTTEPAARLALTVIAEDEARHSELAWAFVRWALEVAPETLALARATFDQTLPHAAAAGGGNACQEPLLRAFGFLSQADRLTERTRAVQELLIPATRALLDT
jgi:hypothetical protein